MNKTTTTTKRVVQLNKMIGKMRMNASQLRKAVRQHELMEDRLKQQETTLKNKVGDLEDRIADFENRNLISEETREGLENKLDDIEF